MKTSCWFRESTTQTTATTEEDPNSDDHSLTFYGNEPGEADVPHSVVRPPESYKTQYLRIVDELNYKNCCAFCDEVFTNSDVGRLACSFHPMAYYACCNRSITYDKSELYGVCQLCAKLHVKAELRDKIKEEETYRRYNCTRVDHTTDTGNLFANLLIGVPTFFASKLALFWEPEMHANKRLNVLLVDKPEFIVMSVEYNVPGVGLHRKRVADIYDCMAEKFNIAILADALHEANKSVKQSISFSQRAGIVVKGEERIQTLYTDDRSKMEFVPFYIIARIQQNRGEMKFVSD